MTKAVLINLFLSNVVPSGWRTFVVYINSQYNAEYFFLVSNKLFEYCKFTSKQREAFNRQLFFVSMLMCTHAI